ncbi:hypothetical protein ACOSP7_027063 [Xanthoceras sorbifolium]
MVSELNETTASATNNDGSPLNMSRNTKQLAPMKLTLTVKLDNKNFLLWRQQVQAVIKGNRLFPFIDPTVLSPSKFNNDGSMSEDFLDWEQQDQILLAWILSSISQELLPEFVGCQTACEAWQTIVQLFSSQSKANVMQLKLQLQTLRKDGSTVSDYLMKKKSLIDNLAFAGYSMSNDDKLMSILSGLGSDYNPFIISVTSVPHSYSIAEITSLLLTHEARMDQTSQFKTLSANLAANKKGNGQVNFVNKSSHQQSGQFPKPANQSQGGYNNYNGGRKGRGRGRNSYTNNRPPYVNNLQQGAPYQGTERIYIGNGNVFGCLVYPYLRPYNKHKLS